MSAKRLLLFAILGLVLWLGLLGADQPAVVAQTPEPQPSPEATRMLDGLQTTLAPTPEVVIDAVRQVEGVLLDKPVDALYHEMGDSAMIFRQWCWIWSYVDTRRVFDLVHTALQHTLDEAGIESPFPTQSVNLRLEQRADDSPPSLSQVSGD